MGVFLNLPTTTTEDIAEAVRTELALELSRLDAAVSTRATPADVQVTVSGSSSYHAEIS